MSRTNNPWLTLDADSCTHQAMTTQWWQFFEMKRHIEATEAPGKYGTYGNGVAE